MHRKVRLWVFSIIIVSGICYSQPPPQDKVWDIAFSPRYVWMAYSNAENRAGHSTIGVLRRYDRATQEWKTYTIADIFGTQFDCEVTAVAIYEDSTVWVGVEPKTGDTPNYACAYTHNNGDSWTPLSEANGIAVNSVDCIEIDPVTQTVWLGHDWGEAYYSLSRSTDGGATWTKLDPNYYNGITAIAAYNNLVWIAADHRVTKVVMKSTDNGVTWTNYDYADSPAFYGDPCDLYMVSPDEVHVAVYNWSSVYDQTAGYAYTTDGGATWHTHQVLKYDEYAKTVTVAEGTVWVGLRWHQPHVLFESQNYGASWEEHNKSNGLPYDDPFVIRYDKYADIVWAGFWSDTFTNFEGGWCWTDDGGATWHTDNPPAIVLTGVRNSVWSLYQ